VRPGTHIPTIYGLLWHIFKNGWEDKDFIHQRVYGMDEIRKEVEKMASRRSRARHRLAGSAGPSASPRTFAKQRPATLIWAMGQTRSPSAPRNVRASCILLLATGNVGLNGGGANIFRGHTNVQGATDLGLDVTTVGRSTTASTEDAWKHWCRVLSRNATESSCSRLPDATPMLPGILG